MNINISYYEGIQKHLVFQPRTSNYNHMLYHYFLDKSDSNHQQYIHVWKSYLHSGRIVFVEHFLECRELYIHMKIFNFRSMRLEIVVIFRGMTYRYDTEHNFHNLQGEECNPLIALDFVDKLSKGTFFSDINPMFNLAYFFIHQ